MSNTVIVSRDDVQSIPSVLFKPELPHPNTILAAEKVARRGPPLAPDAAKTAAFPEKRLFVKFGPRLSIAEGQCLQIIRAKLGGKVPVPEVYGWCRHGAIVFIYMELVEGVPLIDRWDRLLPAEKNYVCKDLRHIVGQLELLRQDHKPFVGGWCAALDWREL